MSKQPQGLKLEKNLHSTLVRFYVKISKQRGDDGVSIYIPHWLDSMNIKFYIDYLIMIIYIPHWLDSMEAILNIVKLNMIIYIPHWLDSMYKLKGSIPKVKKIYIPHWLDSMLF